MGRGLLTPGSESEYDDVDFPSGPVAGTPSFHCQGHGFNNPWLRNQDASLVVPMVKNLSAMRETWVQSLRWEDPLEESMGTH